MNRVKVSAVSYLNTVPFVYGLQHTDIADLISLSLDYPAECARKVLGNESDIGLVPVYTVIHKPNFNIVGDFCIGSNGKVRTVSLLSNVPLNEIETIYLDYQSRTSVALIKVLAKNLWNKKFAWKPFTQNDSVHNLLPTDGVLAIGDKVFGLESFYTFNIDLAEEWKNLTGLPMVFAVWASGVKLEERFCRAFSKALAYGVSNIPKAIETMDNKVLPAIEAEEYLQNNISFDFNSKKREALAEFRKMSLHIDS